MNHLEFASQESTAAAPCAWESWVGAVEKLLGHSLNGMYISLSGTLSLAARSLREMAEVPDSDNADALEAHETRCYESQPALRAQGLEELGKHLGLLKTAIASGDSTTVRQFFEIYRFD